MKQEIIATGRTEAAALESAAKTLNVPAEKLTYEVISAPKKGFLGFGEAPAKLKVTYEPKPIDIALDLVNKIIADMEIKADVTVSEYDGGKKIDVCGDGAAVLIGHHGETLDQLQYLVNLAANRKDGEDDEREFAKIMLDIEGYRAKREETLRALARRMAARADKYRRSVALEPMSAYERRIIHSEIQGIPGVTTSSVGSENNRRVVIYPVK